MKKILFFLLIQFLLVSSVIAQKVSEYVKTNHFTYKCAYCGKTKKEDVIDIESIKNPEIANNASTYAIAISMLNSAGSSGHDICDISRTGKHRYELKSKTVTKELYTADNKSKKNQESGYDIGDKAENDNHKSSSNNKWMSENLNVDKFRNGDPIPEVKSTEEWLKAAENKQPAWCYYDNNPANGATYGKLYNWYAVNDPRGLAPIGYHIPSNNEWSSFSDLYGGGRGRDGNFKDFGKYGNWWTSTEGSTSYAIGRYKSSDYSKDYPDVYWQSESGLMIGKSVRCLKN